MKKNILFGLIILSYLLAGCKQDVKEEKEASTEKLLASKGFENAVVSIGDDSVDVVLNYEELSSADRAQIEDIVTRKTGYSVSQLIISKMQPTES